MNKFELTRELQKKCNLTKKESIDFVNMFFDQMANSLAKGERVEVRGLWSFSIREYESYMGRNPKTGENVKVSPKKLPFFKCGKELKQRTDLLPN